MNNSQKKLRFGTNLLHDLQELTLSLIPFINKPDSSSDLTIFMVSFISSFEVISVAIPDPNIFLWIAASVARAAAVNSNGIKTLLDNGLSTFFN